MTEPHVVYKYQIGFGKSTIVAPPSIHFIHADMQNDEPHVWGIVDHNAHGEKEYEFLILGTGQHYDLSQWFHFKTIMDGPYVWHVFRKINALERLIEDIAERYKERM